MNILRIMIFLMMAGFCFAQEEEAFSLEDLLPTEVRTAAKYKQNIQEAPASVTIVTEEEKSAKSEGSDFSSKLIKLSRIVQ